MSDNAVLAAVRVMGISKEEMCGHGFRAMARTMLNEILGYRSERIEQQLVHQVRDPNGLAYDRTKHLDERKIMMQDWADYMDRLQLSEMADCHLSAYESIRGRMASTCTWRKSATLAKSEWLCSLG